LEGGLELAAVTAGAAAASWRQMPSRAQPSAQDHEAGVRRGSQPVAGFVL
jgi:hypothetical protein